MATATCQHDDCDQPVRFTFGVGPGVFVPTRTALRLCGDHAVCLRSLINDEDGPGQATFFARCRLTAVADRLDAATRDG